MNLPEDERTDVVKNLTYEDFSHGPIPSLLYDGEPLWVFGKDIHGVEYYIKLTLNGKNKSALCVSFHPADRRMLYLFK